MSAARSSSRWHVRDAETVGLLALFSVLLRHRRWILAGAVLAGVLAFVYASILAPRYDARATLFPGSTLESTPGSGMGAGLRAAAQQFGLGSMESADPTEVLREILFSRSFLLSVAADRVLANGDSTTLRAAIREGEAADDGERRTEAYLEAMRNGLGFGVDAESGLITIELRHSDRATGVAVLERIIEELDGFHRALMGERASDVLDFVSTRLDEAEGELRAAEDELRTFSERNQRVADSPQLTLERSRLEREVQIRLATFTTLREQYELARIEQVNEIAVIMVVDRAWSPSQPSWPNRTMFAVLGVLLGAIGMGLVVLVADGLRHPAAAATTAD